MPEEPPNLLFLLGESHAPDLLGALGNPWIKTPNLDALAKRGLLFESAYCASPLCVPARAAVATGRFPHESGYWDSSIAYDGVRDSWMKRLRGAGYETVGVGKMHFRDDTDDYGFSRFMETMQIADGIGDLVSALRFKDAEPCYRGLWDIWTSQFGAGDLSPYRRYDERIVAAAQAWLREEAVSSVAPWALSVHFIAAHAPFVTPEKFYKLYDPSDLPPPIRFHEDERPDHPSIRHLRDIVCHQPDVTLAQVQAVRAAYFATVSYLDDLVGRVLRTLEELGLAETTRVVYTSDHGFSCGDHYIFGLFHLFEEALRVPLILAGPQIPSGARLGDPVSHVDLYPTILEGCGLPPTAEEQGLEARSLWPLIRGRERRCSNFAEYHGTGTKSAGFVLREGPLKLIYFVGMEPQLFDLSADPQEARDLALDAGNRAQVERMIGLLRAKLDPEAVDAQAKADQRALIELHGGEARVREKMSGFAYSPPPGMSWQSINAAG